MSDLIIAALITASGAVLVALINRIPRSAEKQVAKTESQPTSQSSPQDVFATVSERATRLAKIENEATDRFRTGLSASSAVLALMSATVLGNGLWEQHQSAQAIEGQPAGTTLRVLLETQASANLHHAALVATIYMITDVCFAWLGVIRMQERVRSVHDRALAEWRYVHSLLPVERARKSVGLTIRRPRTNLPELTAPTEAQPVNAPEPALPQPRPSEPPKPSA